MGSLVVRLLRASRFSVWSPLPGFTQSAADLPLAILMQNCS